MTTASFAFASTFPPFLPSPWGLRFSTPFGVLALGGLALRVSGVAITYSGCPGRCGDAAACVGLGFLVMGMVMNTIF